MTYHLQFNSLVEYFKNIWNSQKGCAQEIHMISAYTYLHICILKSFRLFQIFCLKCFMFDRNVQESKKILNNYGQTEVKTYQKITDLQNKLKDSCHSTLTIWNMLRRHMSSSSNHNNLMLVLKFCFCCHGIISCRWLVKINFRSQSMLDSRSVKL